MVSEAALELGVSTSLIRRLCRKLELGREVNDRLRLLSPADLEKLRGAVHGRTGNPAWIARRESREKAESRAAKKRPAKKSRKKEATKSRKR
jgi:hypothetical protein